MNLRQIGMLQNSTGIVADNLISERILRFGRTDSA